MWSGSFRSSHERFNVTSIAFSAVLCAVNARSLCSYDPYRSIRAVDGETVANGTGSQPAASSLRIIGVYFLNSGRSRLYQAGLLKYATSPADCCPENMLGKTP